MNNSINNILVKFLAIIVKAIWQLQKIQHAVSILKCVYMYAGRRFAERCICHRNIVGILTKSRYGSQEVVWVDFFFNPLHCHPENLHSSFLVQHCEFCPQSTLWWWQKSCRAHDGFATIHVGVLHILGVCVERDSGLQ